MARKRLYLTAIVSARKKAKVGLVYPQGTKADGLGQADHAARRDKACCVAKTTWVKLPSF
jgi:hypothetical protein